MNARCLTASNAHALTAATDGQPNSDTSCIANRNSTREYDVSRAVKGVGMVVRGVTG